MSHGAIEITVGDVTDMDARVFARYRPASVDEVDKQERIVLRGTLRGPYCDKAQTLPAEFTFRDLGAESAASAEVVVTDPCLWSPDLPHLYRADVEAVRGAKIVAEYHGMVGLRRQEDQIAD